MNNSPKFKKILVTGGAGFIGSAFIRWGLETFETLEKIVNLDLLTYAASEKNMTPFLHDPRHVFIRGDIQDRSLVEALCDTHQIEAIVHFAAESHVDRSITDPQAFIQNNIVGTFALLEVIRKKPHIHFHHVSTDEVYGSLEEGLFNEESPYKPNSPYAASKAASDHLVRAWTHTYQLSTTLSHCSNNYGPCQHEEKFIPRMISHALQGKPLPVYGQGLNIREWLYVDDHVDAIWRILNQGQTRATYTIGGRVEKRNIDLLHVLLQLLAKKTHQDPRALEALITFVDDRPGHDFRYATSATKISAELGWQPLHTLEQGLEKTLNWYLSCPK
jgi:dTDP-glucose 4,6-dehydratase